MNGRPTDGVVRSGRRMLAILVSMVKTRLGLLAVELLQEQNRLMLLLVLTGLALIFVSMALLMLSLLVIVAYWEEGRLLAIGGLLAFYVVATAVTLLILRRKARAGSTLFAGSLGELSKDQAALEDGSDDDDSELDFDGEQGRRHG
jgi:uncharacterized membrane protein YqjE